MNSRRTGRSLSSCLCAALALCTPALRAQDDTIPLSAVTIKTGDATSVQNGIMAAYHAGQKSVQIPPGEYRFAPGAFLHLKELTNFEIKAEGVTFIFDRLGIGIGFDQCKNTSLSGLTVRRDPLPFSQGRIVAISDNRKAIDVRISKGYPMDVDDKTYYPKFFLNAYDASTRLWRADLFPSARDVERIGDDTFRFHAAQAVNASDGWMPGAAVAWRGAVSMDIGVHRCEKMKITDVTIQSGNGFCIYEQYGGGENSYSYTVTYGPTPDGAIEPPLLSSNADAFHSLGVRKGPHLEKCRFEGMNDDGIPIHGQYAMVQEANATEIVIRLHRPPFSQPGDTLRFIDERGVAMEEARVIYSEPVLYTAKKPAPTDLRLFQDAPNAQYERVLLDKPVSAKFAWLAANLNASGDGFSIRDCFIRNHRGRGILLKASNGLIENCTIEHSSMGGIVVAPEISYWNEADYARNVAIRNNTIRECNSWSEPGASQAGALTIGAYEHKAFVPLPGGHQNIVVDNNTFERNDGPNIVISSAEGVAIRDNRFIDPMKKSNDRGKAVGIKPGSLIWITESRAVTLSGNQIEDPGPYLRAPVVTTKTATGTGFNDGVTVQKK